jgi:hypothetical protein
MSATLSLCSAIAAVAERQLQTPHGGELVDLMAPASEHAALVAACTKSVELSDRNACDVELLTVGWGLSPPLAPVAVAGMQNLRPACQQAPARSAPPQTVCDAGCASCLLQRCADMVTACRVLTVVSPVLCGSGFSPLRGFMNEKEYNSVVLNMRLPVRSGPMQSSGT